MLPMYTSQLVICDQPIAMLTVQVQLAALAKHSLLCLLTHVYADRHMLLIVIQERPDLVIDC